MTKKSVAHICGVSEDHVRAGVKSIVLSDSLDIANANARKILKRGQWPRFFFTKGGKGGIARKTYLADRCALSDSELLRLSVTFKKIPRDIARL